MSDPKLDVIGMWEAPPPLSFRILLSADGSGSFNGVAGSWQFDEGVLTIGNESRTHRFDATVADDVLTLTADFMPHPFQLQRVSTELADAPATNAATATPLVGRWRGTQGIAVFRADGVAEMSGLRVAYTADESAITIQTKEGPVRILFSIVGTRLELGVGGAMTILTRIDADTDAADEAAPAPVPEYTKEDALSIQEKIANLTPDELRQSTIAGILTYGRLFGSTLGRLAGLLDHQGPVQEQFEQSRLLYAYWLNGVRLTERADEDELRVNELVSILKDEGEAYTALTRIAAQAVLSLPKGHPSRDLVHVGEALLRHVSWCEENAQPEIEVLTISDLLGLTLEAPGLVPAELAANLIQRGAARLDQSEAGARRRFRTAAVAYYVGSAIGARDAKDTESLARCAQEAQHQLDLLQAEVGDSTDDLRYSWFLVAGLRETTGQIAEAADAYGKSVADDGRGRQGAIHEGRLRVQLGEYQRAVAVLSPQVDALERDYVTALEDAEIESAGESLSNLIVNLTFAHARLGEWDRALQRLDRSKNLRFRYRAALREDPAGRHLLEIERALYGLSRGAVALTDPSRSYAADDNRLANVSLRTHLLEEYRSLRPEPKSDLLESPSVSTIAGLLAPDEAVAILGLGYLGLLLCVIFPGDEAEPGGHRLLEEWTYNRIWKLAGESESGWMYVLAGPEGYRGIGHREALIHLLPALDEPLGAPLAAMLRDRGVRRVTVIPHFWLHQAPLWALPSLGEYRVSMSPSAANFVRARRELAAAPRTVLAVADPTLDLPVSPAEVGSIDRHLSGARWTVARLQREEATETAITAAATGISVLHFCGHGRSDLLRPTRSSLLVHPDRALLQALGPEPFEPLAVKIQDWASSAWDGRYAAVPGWGRLYEIIYPKPNTKERFLEYSETGTLWGRYQGDQLIKLAEMWRAGDLLVSDSLNGCRLAFLSACEGGGGALASREVDEGTGLPGAMHLAGVSTIICSLWPVSDIFTAIYVDLFYEGFASAGTSVDVPELVGRIGTHMRDMTRADASQRLKDLRQRASDPRARFRLEAASATIARGDEQPFRHPAEWAAFFVMGAPVIHLQELNRDADIR